MRLRGNLLAHVPSLLLVVSIASPLAAAPFGLGYRETWNSYATGNADPTYRSVWSAYAITAGTGGNASFVSTTDYPTIGTAGAISTPNAIQYAVKNRALVNSLVDGITSGAVGADELSAGQVLIPDQTAALNTDNSLANVDNLQLRTMINFNGNGTNRSRTGHYVELSYGEIHAPTLTGGLDALGTAIPLIAVGKLDAAVTNSAATADGANTSLYFFDGKQWNRLGNLAVISGLNEIVAKVFYDGVSTYGWSAYIQFLANTGQTVANHTVALQFDPTALGFNTVSYILPNSVTTTPSGTLPTFDDVWVAGGLVVPEPTTLVFLVFGFAAMIRRRTR